MPIKKSIAPIDHIPNLTIMLHIYIHVYIYIYVYGGVLKMEDPQVTIGSQYMTVCQNVCSRFC